MAGGTKNTPDELFILLWYFDLRRQATAKFHQDSNRYMGFLQSMVIFSTFLVECYGQSNASRVLMDLFLTEPEDSIIPSCDSINALKDTIISSTIGYIIGHRPMAATIGVIN